MNHSRPLESQWSLVTGASRGIGRAIAESLAGAGCNVAVASRRRQDCETVAAAIAAKHGVQAIGLQTDVTRFGSVREMFLELRRWSSDRLDVLVCSAGYPMRSEIWDTPLHATPAEQLQSWYLDIYSADALGSVFCTFESLPLMAASGGGRIIYVSSTPALEGYKGTPYTMAKSAILGLMKDVAREYGKDNIRANAVALGNIRTTATFDKLDEETRRALAEEAPLQRWGDPGEVGKAVLFLASNLSSFVSGQVLVVDGGTVRR